MTDNPRMVDLPWHDGTTRKVDVPTGLGAVVSVPGLPNEPGYVLTRNGWHGLRTCLRYDQSEIADKLRVGARVLFRGLTE